LNIKLRLMNYNIGTVVKTDELFAFFKL
jgi:hypothetical protein